ncbi:MAG: hypothetical protein O3A95_04095 [Planctomycetota bacterium]|nr:hypothetical protein [Planctomycetota bacterium]MDA1113464.1 hypothetical protein [Planctomycetota bacterium]
MEKSFHPNKTDSQAHGNPLHSNSERGSVLLLVILVTSLLAAAVLSSLNQVSSMADSARNEASTLEHELVAESAIDYARTRLSRDVSWIGTNGTPVDLGNGVSFEILAGEVNPGSRDGLLNLVTTGLSEAGRMELEVEVQVEAGVVPGADLALVFLGDTIDILDSTIFGDILITDAVGVVDDWAFDEYGVGHHAPGGPFGPFDIDFDGTVAMGDLYKYTDQAYFMGQAEHQISAQVQMPEYDLDEYLVPGPDRIIYYYENNLKNVSHEETAVFVLHPGHTLSLDGCHFPGGVVVYVDKEFNPRDPDINKILLKHHTTIGGGTGGVSPYMGLIAPGAEVQFTYQGCSWAVDHTDIYGFNLWNKVHFIRDARLVGQLVVINEIKHFRETVLYFDPEVANNIPSGINFRVPTGESAIRSVKEHYGP